MACGYFSCSRNALISLNILYLLISILLIGVAAYAKARAVVSSYAVIGAVIGCGVFLALIACMGFIGAVKHHQICLFFYMIILFLLFLIQFSLSVALLAIPQSMQFKLAETGWNQSSHETKMNFMNVGHCCGFKNWNLDTDPTCGDLQCCKDSTDSLAACCGGTASQTNCPCPTCNSKIQSYLNEGCKLTGGVGLFISFTQMFGVIMTVRYRGQRNTNFDKAYM